MTKRDQLIEALRGGWVPAATLQSILGWKATTLRGALSILGRKGGFGIERKREQDVTSYRIKPEVMADVILQAPAQIA